MIDPHPVADGPPGAQGTGRRPAAFAVVTRLRRFGAGDWWVAVVAMTLMIASDYKWRLRDLSQSLRGTRDISTVLEILLYGGVAGYLLLRRATPPRLGRTGNLLFLGWLYSVLLALSAVYSPFRTLAIVRAVQLLIVCGMAQSFARHARPRAFSLFAHVFVLVVTMSIILGRVYPFPRPGIRLNRFTWLEVHPVISGTYLGLAVVVLVACTRASRAPRPSSAFPVLWPTWAYGALLLVNVGALLATRTRGAIGGCVAGCVVVGAVNIGRKRQVDFAVGLAAVAAVVGLAFGPAITRFIERGNTVAQLGTFNARSNLWGEAIDLVRKRPFVGYGLTASRGLFFDTTGLGGGHNALINVVTDGGLIGAVTWIALLVALIVAIMKLRPGSPGYTQKPLLLGALTFLIVNGVTTEGLGATSNISNVWLFVLIAWVTALTGLDHRRTRGRAIHERSPR